MPAFDFKQFMGPYSSLIINESHNTEVTPNTETQPADSSLTAKDTMNESASYVVALMRDGAVVGFHVSDDQDVTSNLSKAAKHDSLKVAEVEANLNNTQWDLQRNEKFVVLPLEAARKLKVMMSEATANPFTVTKLVEMLKAQIKEIEQAKDEKSVEDYADNRYLNLRVFDLNRIHNVYLALLSSSANKDFTSSIEAYEDLGETLQAEIPMKLTDLIEDVKAQFLGTDKPWSYDEMTNEAADAFAELNTNVFEIKDEALKTDILRTTDALARAIERDTETTKATVLKALQDVMVKGTDIRSKAGEPIVDIAEFLQSAPGKAGTIVAKLKSGKFIKISLR